MKTAGYYRVSQSREGMHSPELYENEIRRHCAYARLGEPEMFSDIDRSGYNNPRNRPALNVLLERRKEFSAVVIPKVSRFGRSLRHLCELFETFDRDGIALVFLDLGLDTSTSQGRLLRHIMAAFAEYESDIKSDYGRANYRHAMEEGRTWGLPPFGYRTRDKRYYIVQQEADIVRRVFRRYAEGGSLHRIAIELNDLGLKGRRKGMWRNTAIGRLLDNPAYAGLTILDEDTYRARWKAIVPRDLWNEVQRQRLPENRGQRTRKVGTGGPYLLTGLIRCGTCGGSCHHHRKKPSSAYRCFKHDHSTLCPGGSITRTRADRIVTEAALERVRFTLGAHVEFVRSIDAWEAATMAQRRHVLGSVIERVVIEPREPGEGRASPRRLRIEWKRDFSGELTPMPNKEPRPNVKVGRPETNRAARETRRAALNKLRGERAAATKADWNAIRSGSLDGQESR
jgi:DNA invertase Pin-like site-specific DNA recombinase